MKTEKIDEFKKNVQEWLNFNKNRGTISLLDLSRLLVIIKKYYTLKLKRGMK